MANNKEISTLRIDGTDYTIVDSTVTAYARMNSIPSGVIYYNGQAGNIVAQRDTLTVAIKAIDDAIGDIETLLANI